MRDLQIEIMKIYNVFLYHDAAINETRRECAIAGNAIRCICRPLLKDGRELSDEAAEPTEGFGGLLFLQFAATGSIVSRLLVRHGIADPLCHGRVSPALLPNKGSNLNLNCGLPSHYGSVLSSSSSFPMKKDVARAYTEHNPPPHPTRCLIFSIQHETPPMQRNGSRKARVCRKREVAIGVGEARG